MASWAPTLKKQVKEQNGDLEVNSVTGTDGKLYGVPYTDNTWFMYYNKSKITEDEAKDFDTILSKAKVAFSLQNSWYINGFYDGLSLFGEKGNDADAGMVFPRTAPISPLIWLMWSPTRTSPTTMALPASQPSRMAPPTCCSPVPGPLRT